MTGRDYDRMGETWADIYDDTYPGLPANDPMIEFLAEELPIDEQIIEIGIGTGRVALPLADKGFRITGLDASQKMLDILAEKDPQRRIHENHCASMTDFDLGDKRFGGAFSVFNTLNFVTTLEEQIATFERAAHHLLPGGILVIEISNPAQTTLGYDYGRGWHVQELDNDHIAVMTGRHDPLAQTINLKHVILHATGTRILPADLRYLWPAELRLITQTVGLQLQHIYGDWDRSPLTPRSARLLLVARKPA